MCISLIVICCNELFLFCLQECPSRLSYPTQPQTLPHQTTTSPHHSASSPHLSTSSAHTSPSSSTSPSASTSSDDLQSPEPGKSMGPPPHPHPHPHPLPKHQSADDTTHTHASPVGMRQRSKTLGDVPLTPTTPSTPSNKERLSFQFEGDKFKALRPTRQKPPLIRYNCHGHIWGFRLLGGVIG